VTSTRPLSHSRLPAARRVPSPPPRRHGQDAIKTQTKTGGAAKALLATAVALLAATAADARTACEYVPIHRILAPAGGVYKLADGWQLKATRLDVDGCTTMPGLQSGIAYPDTNSNYTVMSHESDACITGTGRNGSTPTYAGFQAIIVEANGFKFSADLVLEDIDAQPVDDPTKGWRETMSSLAMADGAVVRPSMTTKPGSLVAVQPFRVPRASLKEVGFPSSDDLLISGAAYSSWTETKSMLVGFSRGRVALGNGGRCSGRCCVWWAVRAVVVSTRAVD